MDLTLLDTRFGKLKTGADQLIGRVHSQEQAVEQLAAEVAGLDSETSILGLTSTALETLLNQVSVESLESVERLVTYGLQTIFDDQHIQFKIEVQNKRGVQWMEPKLVKGGVEAPILDAFGGGPASVVAFLPRLMVCRRLGLAPVLLLDESFSMVSSGYVGNVAKLLRELAEKFGFTIILVTHQEEFLQYAHHKYVVKESSGGTVFTPV